jgi:hypothetical protein
MVVGGRFFRLSCSGHGRVHFDRAMLMCIFRRAKRTRERGTNLWEFPPSSFAPMAGPCKARKGLILRASHIFRGIWKNIGGLKPQYLVTGATRIPPGFPRPWFPKALQGHSLVIIRNEKVVVSWRSPRALKPLLLGLPQTPSCGALFKRGASWPPAARRSGTSTRRSAACHDSES